jgi:hypothetical protein
LLPRADGIRQRGCPIVSRIEVVSDFRRLACAVLQVLGGLSMQILALLQI